MIKINKMKNCQQSENLRLNVLSSAKIPFVLLILVLSFTHPTLVLADFIRNFSPNLKPFSENSTVVLPTTNDTQKTPTNTTFQKPDDYLERYPWFCHYTSDLEENENESECYCEGRKLTKIPQILPKITRLTIANAHIKVLRDNALKVYAGSLRDLFFSNLQELDHIEPGAFKNIDQLRTIYISNSPNLQKIDPETFKHISHSFKTLRIINCGLKEIPDMRLLSAGILFQLDFEGNQISEIHENSIQITTEQLTLDNNIITTVHRAAFNGSEIEQLSLKGNRRLQNIHEFAFEGVVYIRKLDLSGTSIHFLPSVGLEKLEELKIENTLSLKQIPSVYSFRNLERAYLTHPFHCCAFKFPQRHDPMRHREYLINLKKFQECKIEKVEDYTTEATQQPIKSVQRRRRSSSSLNGMSTFDESHSSSTVTESNNEYEDIMNDNLFEGTFHLPVELNHSFVASCGNLSPIKTDIQCFPVPDELNPCEDVMGSNWLRISVWVVVALTVIGNVSVLVVLFSNRSELTVPKFLMCNLSFADLCMGLYLLLIASIDLHSMGEYFNFAYDWQFGLGCKTAGFLTVFAGHLSIFTLTIITVERWFAITHAIYLNKRLKFKTTVVIMLGGWIYSFFMAAMPLFGVSNYSSTSICLPMEAIDPLDIAYLITVLAVNGLGFFIVCICYSQIYFSLSNETRTRSTTSGEMTIAKKFALLVFTNFACWAPIAFFGLTALAGYPLIDVTGSKILLVFFYPINSCANPYLYAILTAQYRRDFFLLLSKYGMCTKRAQKYKMIFSNNTNTVPLNQVSNRANHPERQSSKNNNHDAQLLSLSSKKNGNGEKTIGKYEDFQV